MNTSKVSRKQKIAFLNEYAAGKQKPKEIDYSNFTDDELRWLVVNEHKIQNGTLSENESRELKCLIERIKWV